MQLYLMIHASLLYIFYICNYPLYRDQALRRHELANEVVVMLIYYHLALLSNVAWEPEIKRVLGHSLTGSVLLLVLGDRYEIFAAAASAMIGHNIKLR